MFCLNIGWTAFVVAATLEVVTASRSLFVPGLESPPLIVVVGAPLPVPIPIPLDDNETEEEITEAEVTLAVERASRSTN